MRITALEYDVQKVTTIFTVFIFQRNSKDVYSRVTPFIAIVS